MLSTCEQYSRFLFLSFNVSALRLLSLFLVGDKLKNIQMFEFEGNMSSLCLIFGTMSKLRILDFKRSLYKRRPCLSIKDRQLSDLKPAFKPNYEEMKQVFDKISEHGKISEDNLKSLLEKLGKTDVAREAKRMIEVADLKEDGFIDFCEFLEVHKKSIRTCEIRSAFSMFDQDGDGQISAEELKSMLEKLGENHTLEQCRRMIKHVDRNGDGFVDMGDFLAMMTRTWICISQGIA